MRVLARFWQMLLKALEEVAIAPNAMMAAEMAVIRLTHVADLPAPEDLLRRLQDAPPPPPHRRPLRRRQRAALRRRHLLRPLHGPRPPARRRPHGHGPDRRAGPLAGAPSPLAQFATFESVVALIRAQRDMRLLMEVETHLRLVRYAPGRIEFEPTDDAPPDLAARLAGGLQAGPARAGRIRHRRRRRHPGRTAPGRGSRALRPRPGHPLVQAVLHAFPGARITAVRAPEPDAPSPAEEALPEVEDEWDPFEDN
jgi:DNA polymerase III subunit gamma/tau